MKRTWSPAAEAKLRALYPSTPLPRLARMLGRTQKALRSRAKILGVTNRERAAAVQHGRITLEVSGAGRRRY